MSKPTDVQGTLDLLILRVVAIEPMQRRTTCSQGPLSGPTRFGQWILSHWWESARSAELDLADEFDTRVIVAAR
jgi:hypothetical protein